MAPSSKRRSSAKIAAKDGPKMASAAGQVESHLANIALAWPKMSAEQRRGFLDHSPIFRRIIVATAPFRDVI